MCHAQLNRGLLATARFRTRPVPRISTVAPGLSWPRTIKPRQAVTPGNRGCLGMRIAGECVCRQTRVFAGIVVETVLGDISPGGGRHVTTAHAWTNPKRSLRFATPL